jgi:[ribosomal protein S5]-alanine N-acetyltransferase
LPRPASRAAIFVHRRQRIAVVRATDDRSRRVLAARGGLLAKARRVRTPQRGQPACSSTTIRAAMIVLHTERLRLRELTLADAEFIVELVNDEAWLRFIGDKNVHSVSDAERYLREGPLASYGKNGFGLWCVELASGGERLGMCGLIKRDTLEDVDIGFAFLERHRGRGFAREAARATIEHGFDSLVLPRIVAITDVDNVRSQRVLEQIGMRFERYSKLPPSDTQLALYAASAPSALTAAPRTRC